MMFAVIAVDNPVAMANTLTRVYPGNHLNIAPAQWLVVDRGTAKDVADKLGVSDGSSGGALVVSISGYFGLKEANLWEWMKANWAGS